MRPFWNPLIKGFHLVVLWDFKYEFEKMAWHPYLTSFVEEYLKFVCMPNGYGPAMRIFTKISKIPFSIFKEKGFLFVVYVDDSYLQGDDYDEDCFSNVLIQAH